MVVIVLAAIAVVLALTLGPQDNENPPTDDPSEAEATGPPVTGLLPTIAPSPAPRGPCADPASGRWRHAARRLGRPGAPLGRATSYSPPCRTATAGRSIAPAARGHPPRDDHIEAYHWNGTELAYLWRVGGCDGPRTRPRSVRSAAACPTTRACTARPVVYRGRIWVAGIRPARPRRIAGKSGSTRSTRRRARVATRTHLGTGTPVAHRPHGRGDPHLPRRRARARRRVDGARHPRRRRRERRTRAVDPSLQPQRRDGARPPAQPRLARPRPAHAQLLQRAADPGPGPLLRHPDRQQPGAHALQPSADAPAAARRPWSRTSTTWAGTSCPSTSRASRPAGRERPRVARARRQGRERQPARVRSSSCHGRPAGGVAWPRRRRAREAAHRRSGAAAARRASAPSPTAGPWSPRPRSSCPQAHGIAIYELIGPRRRRQPLPRRAQPRGDGPRPWQPRRPSGPTAT